MFDKYSRRKKTIIPQFVKKHLFVFCSKLFMSSKTVRNVPTSYNKNKYVTSNVKNQRYRKMARHSAKWLTKLSIRKITIAFVGLGRFYPVLAGLFDSLFQLVLQTFWLRLQSCKILFYLSRFVFTTLYQFWQNSLKISKSIQ